jgi:hypothetical protein
MFYAPVLFKTIGFGGTASLMSSVISGGVNMLATFVSIATVDRLGRRKLLLEGGCQMIIAQVRKYTLPKDFRLRKAALINVNIIQLYLKMALSCSSCLVL